MKNNAIRILSAASIALMFIASPVHAAEQKTVLKLGGNYCEFYPKDITAALKGVKGVTGVDLSSKPGNAVVTHDASATADQLVAAVNGVKGAQWFCTGEVAK